MAGEPTKPNGVSAKLPPVHIINKDGTYTICGTSIIRARACGDGLVYEKEAARATCKACLYKP